MPINLETLPTEVLLHVLSFLSIPDLLSLTRTCHILRHLACDPVLHTHRLHSTSIYLAHTLPNRPSISTLRPPRALILLSRTHVLARSLSRRLVSVRLNHNLSRRPSASSLVERSILPRECTSYSSPVAPALIQSRQAVLRQHLRAGLGRKLERRPSPTSLVSLNILPPECATRTVSPALISTRRQVIRESLKDGLRAWVEGRGVAAQKRKADELDASERTTVKALVRRFTARRLAAAADEVDQRPDAMALEKRRAQVRWGRDADSARVRECEERRRGLGACSQPTRAHVLNLKRFWEGVIHTRASAS